MQNTLEVIAKDNGDWLSAQQAVRPDGTEVTNLPLVNKKLPPLVLPEREQFAASSSEDANSEAIK
ncbi:hypothetical protein H8K35_10040 [Undibacterium sp. LX40W]|uniref:Uncharacterized protein n=1 Tax=Undibacterium nitidum TaxID=2762298 RepID=A0A923HT08_9BURK|nr:MULTISPECIES: hypothetical protein [Undibacterium]MBC3882007.1 hypothetical protein [Undibacterium nitidum]MBC3891997.1 hypothetical protein [Undibacterium sp. LX40W]